MSPRRSQASCPGDCACGDGLCSIDLGETHSSCPQDCTCGNGMCENGCTASQLEMRYPGGGWSPSMIKPSCNETTATCGIDCHCGDGVCDPVNWGEDPHNCNDCFCGDGVCSVPMENWLSCEVDCQAVCGNGVCECTASGEWGSPLCCFGGLDGTHTDAHCTPTEVNGPETQLSCPYDCGTPCPPVRGSVSIPRPCSVEAFACLVSLVPCLTDP